MRYGWLVPAGAVAAVLVVAACGSSTASSGGSGGSGGSPAAASSSGSVLKSGKVGSATVLTNAKGLTLYWFVPDTSTKSNCNGTCSHYWVPVHGPVTAGSGVSGQIGLITRSDGSKQATFKGHPLYTYIGDSGPGMAKGNGLNLSGGVWHEIVLTGTAASGGGGGGYGY
jgi:predicted lipoprotein with Yx(FWY)xxD motif